MAQVRVILAEMSGSDASVLAAVQSFVSANSTVMAVELPPAVAPPAAIEAPAVERIEVVRPATTSRKPKVGKRAKAVKAAPVAATPTVRAAVEAAIPAAEAKVPKMGGCRGDVYLALKQGPATTPALVERFSQYSSASVYLALKELRNAGVVRTKLEAGEPMNSLLT